MDQFFLATNLSKLIQQTVPILWLSVILTVLILGSELLFGLNIRGAIDELEALLQASAQGTGGNPWPLTALLIAGLFAIVWLVRGP